jgi:hypothetical protein
MSNRKASEDRSVLEVKSLVTSMLFADQETTRELTRRRKHAMTNGSRAVYTKHRSVS